MSVSFVESTAGVLRKRKRETADEVFGVRMLWVCSQPCLCVSPLVIDRDFPRKTLETQHSHDDLHEAKTTFELRSHQIIPSASNKVSRKIHLPRQQDISVTPQEHIHRDKTLTTFVSNHPEKNLFSSMSYHRITKQNITANHKSFWSVCLEREGQSILQSNTNNLKCTKAK